MSCWLNFASSCLPLIWEGVGGGGVRGWRRKIAGLPLNCIVFGSCPCRELHKICLRPKIYLTRKWQKGWGWPVNHITYMYTCMSRCIICSLNLQNSPILFCWQNLIEFDQVHITLTKLWCRDLLQWVSGWKWLRKEWKRDPCKEGQAF